MMDTYDNLSREDLIRELEQMKAERAHTLTDAEKSSTQRMLTNMISLRKILSDVLTLLLSSDDDAIDQALLLLIPFFKVDRVYIGDFEESNCTVDFTHEVTENEILSYREDLLRQLSEDEIPWWIKNFKAGKDIIICNVAQMPAEAANEKHLLELQDVRSLLALPLFRNGKVYGFIGLDAVKEYKQWSAIDVENLRMLADIISVAIERSKALKEKKKSDNLFRDLYQKLPWGVELYDKNGYMLDINEADLKIFGTTRAGTLGINMFDNPNIPEYVNEKLRKGEDVSFQLSYNFSEVTESQYYPSQLNRGIKHLQVKGVPLKDDKNSIFGYFYIVFDDTEQHAIEIENKMFGYAVSQSNNEIFALDSKARLVFCNQRVMDNYDFKEPVSQYVLQNINPSYSMQEWEEVKEYIREHQSITLETTHHLANGEILPVEVYIYRVEDKQWGELFWCFIRDITQRIKQRQKISWLNSLMDTLLNNVPVVISVKNVNEDFRHIYFNSTAEKFTGKRKEEVLGRTDFEIFGDIQYAIDVRNQDLLAVKNGANIQYAVEYRNYCGEIRIINSSRLLVNFSNNDNQPMVIVLIWDITEQRKNEIELIKAKEADKLKSAFLANMSHEIRTPLNAIVGFSSILAETDNAEERNTYKEIIARNNDLLLQLINDILDFSKIEAGMMEFNLADADMKEICQEVCQMHSFKTNPGVPLVFDEKNHPSIVVNTDMKRVIQVISNFITNAVKFTKEGSITLSYRPSGKELYVSVTDTGIGISEEHRNAIFERFVKVNDFNQGTGLGLSISKMIIENLNGQIGVESEPGKGSTFWFTLPLKEEYIKQLEKETPPLQEVTGSSTPKTILIAEDVEENYFLLHTLLSKNYELYHAWNGREAVELYQLHRPDLILMDMKMPVMDGFEATREIRKLAPDLPIVALTAFAFDTEKQKARECGVTDYVVKPVEITFLRRLIAQLLK